MCVEVRTSKYELLQSDEVKGENRAVGFSGKEASFDWLTHVVLNVNFSAVCGCLVHYDHTWPEIVKPMHKIGYSISSRLASNRDISA